VSWTEVVAPFSYIDDCEQHWVDLSAVAGQSDVEIRVNLDQLAGTRIYADMIEICDG